MTLARLIAVLAALLFLGALAWMFLAEHPVAQPGEPRINAEPVPNLEAAIPAIGTFDSYHVNTANPFVPSAEREEESKRIEDARKPVPKPPAPKPPAVVPDPTLPKITPTPAAAGPLIPVAFGILGYRDTQEALVLLPGGEKPVQMKVGEESNGWRLTSVEDGVVVVFTEIATGQVQRLVVDAHANDNDAPPIKVMEPKKPAAKDPKSGEKKSDPKTGDKPKSDGKTDKPSQDKDRPKPPADHRPFRTPNENPNPRKAY